MRSPVLIERKVLRASSAVQSCCPDLFYARAVRFLVLTDSMCLRACCAFPGTDVACGVPAMGSEASMTAQDLGVLCDSACSEVPHAKIQTQEKSFRTVHLDHGPRRCLPSHGN
eukprot:3940501-Rhodomonas_salina.4